MLLEGYAAWQIKKTTNHVAVFLTHTSQEGEECPKSVVALHVALREVTSHACVLIDCSMS